MPLGWYCGSFVVFSLRLSLFSNLISKKCSKDCNVAEDTNENDKTVDDDEAQLGCTRQSKKDSLVLSEYILTRLQDVGTR